MNPIKITRKLNKKAAIKIVAAAYLVLAATYGTQAMFHDTSKAAAAALDGFAAARMGAKGLGTVTVREVPVIDPAAAAAILSDAARQGAKEGSDLSIATHLAGK